MRPLQESNLRDEVADIAEFITLLHGDGGFSKVIVTPNVYSRHMSVLYLVIECMRNEVFMEAKMTGEYKSWYRLDAWLKGLGL